ncbi:hypothetical protein L798_06356 [Zootermopsis nevadensis]|uniref:Endonuclease-reverse transcriptase n=1 Tax=Zootermopsis nevadensis TaxID=136037 RepID=A0A067RJI6_ZOONE|nr:hypothetical protein L798_06356 [Zootermopsis nevadensis]
MLPWTKKQLRSRHLTLKTKCILYKTLLRPVLLYGSESWALTKGHENKLRVFERKILRKIYGPKNEEGNWQIRYNDELYHLYNEPDVIKVLKTGRLRWLGHLYRASEAHPSKKVTFTNIEGTRKRGRPPIRWLDSVDSTLSSHLSFQILFYTVEQDLKALGVQGWKRKAVNRDQWKHCWGSQGLQ